VDSRDASGRAALYRYRFGDAVFDESRFELEVAGAVVDLSGVRTDLVTLLGATSPQAQSVSYYLAAFLAAVESYAAAAPLLQDLRPTDLASAEPRDDWAPRLDALRGTILRGQGHYADAVALLAPAVKAMQEQHTPPPPIWSRSRRHWRARSGILRHTETLRPTPFHRIPNILDHRSKPGASQGRTIRREIR